MVLGTIGFLASRTTSTTQDSVATGAEPHVTSTSAAKPTEPAESHEFSTGAAATGRTDAGSGAAGSAKSLAENDSSASSPAPAAPGGYLGSAANLEELTTRVQQSFAPAAGSATTGPTADRSAGSAAVTSACPAPAPPDGGVLRFAGTARLAGRPVAVFGYSTSAMSDALTLSVLDASSCAPV